MKDLKVLAEELANLTVEEVDAINKELTSKNSSVVIGFVVSASVMSSKGGTDEAVSIGGGDRKEPGDDDIKVPPIGGGFPGDPIVIPGKGKGSK